MQSPDIHIFLKKAQKIKVKNDTLFLAMIRAKKNFLGSIISLLLQIDSHFQASECSKE